MPCVPNPSDDFLLCRSGERLCALPLAHVVETMRPLPTRPIPGMPPFLLGVAIIRDVTAPVLSLGRLLGEAAPATPTRFVTLRLAQRIVALACDEVLGVRTLAAQLLADIPLLLQALDSGSVSAITTLDAELMLILRSARMVSDAVWAALDAWEPAA